MLGHDLEMSCAKFQGNRYRIDREIDRKHALQLSQSRPMSTCSLRSKLSDSSCTIASS